MDINYLLWLQDFRNAIHDSWTPFMMFASSFAVRYLFLIPVFIYWCVNKRKGLYTLAAFHICIAINAFIKLTACVYRPWIKDARVIPAGNAIATAPDYSFPSGHTATATPLYGGMAVGFWDNKKTKWLSVLCVIAILITGFSRNYLGVHTPQDVFVGLSLGIFILWVTHVLFNYLTAHPEKEDWFLLGGVLLTVLALVYVTFKSYPMDYVDGKLLVDPQHMMRSSYKDIASLGLFCIARYIEKRWVRFQPLGLNVKGILLSLAGLILGIILLVFLRKPCTDWLGALWGRVLHQGILINYFILIFPVVISFFQPKKD